MKDKSIISDEEDIINAIEKAKGFGMEDQYREYMREVETVSKKVFDCIKSLYAEEADRLLDKGMNPREIALTMMSVDASLIINTLDKITLKDIKNSVIQKIKEREND